MIEPRTANGFGAFARRQVKYGGTAYLFSANCDGVEPVYFLNTWLKYWGLLPNPTASAMT